MAYKNNAKLKNTEKYLDTAALKKPNNRIRIDIISVC